MTIRNVIIRDFNEVHVFSYDNWEKAEKHIEKLQKEILEEEGLTEEEFINKQKAERGEDSVVRESEYIDIYCKDYEAYIERSEIL